MFDSITVSSFQPFAEFSHTFLSEQMLGCALGLLEASVLGGKMSSPEYRIK